MTKVQLSLTNQETAILESYGSQFGYNLAKTIRYIITKTSEEFLKQNKIPVFPMSKKTESIALKALKDYKEGKTHEIKDIDEFLDNL